MLPAVLFCPRARQFENGIAICAFDNDVALAVEFGDIAVASKLLITSLPELGKHCHNLGEHTGSDTGDPLRCDQADDGIMRAGNAARK